MFNSFTKYFSLLLVLFLINSNYSFAYTQMLCNMSNNKTECECKADSETDEMHLSTKDSECCKVKTHEINNSNTLEKNKTSYNFFNTHQAVIYVLPLNVNQKTTSNSNIQNTFKIPISDIPILYSSLLI